MSSPQPSNSTSASPDASAPPPPKPSKPEDAETSNNSQPPESSSGDAAGGGDGGELEAREAGEEEEEEEEEGECGFCLFMKGGGCKESFTAWEKCVEEAEKNKEDVVDKCFEVTALLKKCMDAHAEYYAPVLQAEKAMEEEAARELEQASKDNQVDEGKSQEPVEAVEEEEK